MNFGEQLEELVLLSKTTSTEMDRISKLKEDSDLSMKQINNSFDNMKSLFPILQSIKTLIKQLIQVQILFYIYLAVHLTSFP